MLNFTSADGLKLSDFIKIYNLIRTKKANY